MIQEVSKYSHAPSSRKARVSAKLHGPNFHQNVLSEIYQNFLCEVISYQLYYNNKGAY